LSNGPYPTFGVYMATYLFCNPDHTYIPILPDLVLLTAQGIMSGRIRRTWEVRDAILSEEQAKEQAIDVEFERTWQATHGPRRGVSFAAGGVIQNDDAQIAAYRERLIASGIKIKKEEFMAGFKQA
jgi:hypothetical protein